MASLVLFIFFMNCCTKHTRHCLKVCKKDKWLYFKKEVTHMSYHPLKNTFSQLFLPRVLFGLL